MSWRYVVSIVVGFFAAVFGLQWLSGQRRDDKRAIDDARETEKRELDRIKKLERLNHDAANARLAAELNRLSPEALDRISVGDALDVLNGSGGDDAGPPTDT